MFLKKVTEFLNRVASTSSEGEGSAPGNGLKQRFHGLVCSKPFTWFEVSRGNEEGEVFVCCPSWLNRPIGNLTRQSVAEVWNSKPAQEIRHSILDGSFRYCDARRCPFLQTVSGPVQRIEDVTDSFLAQIIREGITVVPYGPQEINCSYDRSCNLSCPSCRTELIMEHQNKDRILGIQRKITESALQDARLLYITGSGDPFGSPYFRRWLQAMKRSDMPKLEVIHLHTNGLLWSRRMWESIPEEIRALIKSTDISIDAATPETYAVNRRGGIFQRLLENLEFIASLRCSGPLEWLGINMTVQRNNYREMKDFIEIGRRFGCDAVAFHQISNWGTFTDAEFIDCAIHQPSHPEHAEFQKILADPAFDDPIVYVSNLTDIRAKARHSA